MARNHLGITDAGRVEVSHWHFPHITRRQIFWATILVCLVIGFSLLGLSQTLWQGSSSPNINLLPPNQPANVAPIPPASSTPSSTGVPVPSPTAIPVATPTATPTPEKVLNSDMGYILLEIDVKSKIWRAYGLGTWFVPPGTPYYYEFPLILRRESKEATPNVKILATIPDPNIEELGGEWSSGLIRDTDPGYENFVCQVKLTRVVGKSYKYKTEFLVSPDNGNNWYPPLHYPAGDEYYK